MTTLAIIILFSLLLFAGINSLYLIAKMKRCDHCDRFLDEENKCPMDCEAAQKDFLSR